MSHPNIVHWDDVEEHDFQEGSIHSRWRYLGEAAGTVGVGVNRVRVDPGCRSTPLHAHGHHEEVFFVLGGSGRSWQRTDAGEDVVCEVGAGTCIVHLAAGAAHTLVAGPDGLDVLVYGNGRRSGDGGYDRRWRSTNPFAIEGVKASTPRSPGGAMPKGRLPFGMRPPFTLRALVR
jgi:uncharacterized cupin superfamily protein